MEEPTVICRCGALIPCDNIEIENKENEEGEEYGRVIASCDSCNSAYETFEWGEWESDQSAIECLKDYIENNKN